MRGTNPHGIDLCLFYYLNIPEKYSGKNMYLAIIPTCILIKTLNH